MDESASGWTICEAVQNQAHLSDVGLVDGEEGEEGEVVEGGIRAR